MKKIVSQMENNIIFFQNKDVSEQLKIEGCVIVDFLLSKEIEALEEVYNKYKDEINNSVVNGIHMTNWISNIPIKYAIKQSISEKIKEACDRHFKNYTIQNEVFIVKNQHKISNFPLHQDWSFVDENQYKTINIWIAFQDTSAKNGGLYVIKGSHHLKNKIRGAGKLSLDFDHYKKKLNPHLTQLHLKKGQAVFFYHSLIHGSPSNTTSEPRKIISLSALPLNAKNIINQYDEITNTLFQYEVNADFSFEYENIRAKKPLKIPIGTLVNAIPNYVIEDISIEDIKQVAVTNNNSLINKIVAFFYD